MIKVENNIKMPRSNVSGAKTEARHEYPWGAMRVGQSFIFPSDIADATARTMAYNAGVRIGRKFATRKMGDVLRCWRIK